MIPMAVKTACWITRSFHNLPGRWRIVDWLGHQDGTFSALSPKTVGVGDSYRMHVDPTSFDGRPIYIHGFDPQDWITRSFKNFVRPGDNVLDIGGNVGCYTLLAAQLVGKTGSVHTFEASPTVFKELKANVDLNPQANVTLYNKAVSNEIGELEFHTATDDHTGRSSIRDLGTATGNVAKVPAITIDSILDEIPTIRFIKIDVEGAEQLVIEGMAKLIERDKPFVVLELTDEFLKELGGSAQSLCQILKDAGYELYRIGTRAGLTRFDDPPHDQCNILARHPSQEWPANLEIHE